MAVHDPAKIGRLARERFSSALMSDAKWRKLLTAVATADRPIREMVVKFIDVDEPCRMRFPPSLEAPHAYMDTIEFGPVELRAIEWLELPVAVEPLLSGAGHFPLEPAERGTRIVGYRL